MNLLQKPRSCGIICGTVGMFFYFVSNILDPLLNDLPIKWGSKIITMVAVGALIAVVAAIVCKTLCRNPDEICNIYADESTLYHSKATRKHFGFRNRRYFDGVLFLTHKRLFFVAIERAIPNLGFNYSLTDIRLVHLSDSDAKDGITLTTSDNECIFLAVDAPTLWAEQIRMAVRALSPSKDH